METGFVEVHALTIVKHSGADCAFIEESAGKCSSFLSFCNAMKFAFHFCAGQVPYLLLKRLQRSKVPC
jgi:hypothetical protein